MNCSFTALEFFSGIGAFAEASKSFPIKILAAFDQSDDANAVYTTNHRLVPRARNLDSITSDDLPDADIWWLSPSCKPYSVRGNRNDERDARAQSLLNIIALIPGKLPGIVMLENVEGFVNSTVHQRLLATLQSHGYSVLETDLCPTVFGTPMKRPRHFVVAARGISIEIKHPIKQSAIPLSSLLHEGVDVSRYALPEVELSRYRDALNIINPEDPLSAAICFTSNYWKCRNAGGSFIALKNGGARYFTPPEMAILFGFPEAFRFPPDMPDRVKWRLLGNSVHVPTIRHLLSSLPL
jgi:site-specific DNA-cytosine methylase